MLGKETIKVLNSFGDRVVIDAKKNLKRKNKVASGSLINSIDYKVKVSKNSFELDFFMEDYWQPVDYGVEGIGGTKADGTKWQKKRVTNNKFTYRHPAKTNSRGRFLQSLNGWSIKRGIAPRDDSGKFIKRRSLLYAIRKSIFHTGIETTNFFTNPFDKGFDKLPEEIVESYALDVEELLEFAIK